MKPGVQVEARHVELWKKAAPHTVPSKVATKPTYSAWHRQRAERVVEHEPEADAPEMSQAVR